MSAHCQPRPPRRATTLIEVLLGLVVLSTLLVSVALARGRFLRQYADADRRLADLRAADQLMSNWLAGPPSAVPLAGHGVLATGATWQTHVIPSPPAATLAARVVRLDLFNRPGTAATASIEFLVHDVRAPSTQAVLR